MQVVRDNKLKCLLLLLVFSLLIALVMVALAGGSDPQRHRRVLYPTVLGAARRTYWLLAGIPQRGAELGDPDAPVTIEFFGDLQCKESRQVMLGPLPIVIRRWVRPGKVRLIYASLETDTR